MIRLLALLVLVGCDGRERCEDGQVWRDGRCDDDERGLSVGLDNDLDQPWDLGSEWLHCGEPA